MNKCGLFWRTCEVRISRNPRTTSAGLAALLSLAYPHHADAILAVTTALIGLLSADAGAPPQARN